MSLASLRLFLSPLLQIPPTPTLSPSLVPKQLSTFKQKASLVFTTMGTSNPILTTASVEQSQPSVDVKDQINLTVKEKQIFERLIEVVSYFKLQTQLRVAGGWVRDKLLGKECYDIDIALDNILGKEFCEKVNEYLSAAGEKTPGIHVIQCNPDQSKHLETAKMFLFDIWIDFVNLRAEDYSGNSRIPTMKFGTAKEDAFRRDLTINSLFYNINTNSVEDFTERGISDLKSGKIVTPLPPKQTFLDDPLRVLRAIRFGARFGFILDEDLKLAAADDDVRAAIAEKISRERVGHEIGLMISGNQPTKAMMYVAELHLFWSVFSLPSEFDPPVPEKCDRLCVSYMRSSGRLLELIGGSFFTDDQRRLCLYSALFLPFRHTVYRDKKKKIPVVSYIFRNSLKLKSSDAEAVINLHKTLDKFLSLMPFFTSEYDAESIEVSWKRESADISSSSKLRVLTGLLLIDIKEFWRVALVLSVLLYPVDISCSTESAPSELVKRTEIFKRIEDEILKLGLENVWEMKPLLNGKDIMNILDLKTGGPVVREWQQRLLEWQLAHPSATSDACIDWMKESCSKRSRTN
ncbi:hypothetical protein Leryth_009439 [Lithospermum erythrorhizon]|nr:hypothetical protein Leryth_009439 [Lithospermum erythrorhizon]